MKATGIVRKVDELGRIVIPKELRKVYGMPEGTPIEIFTDDGTIVLRKYESGDEVQRIDDLINYIAASPSISNDKAYEITEFLIQAKELLK